MKQKKIVFVNTHFFPDYHFGGVVESGSNLFLQLNEHANVTGLCVSKDPISVSKYFDPIKVVACKSNLFHRFGFSVSFLFKAIPIILNADIVFINGIMTFPATVAQALCALFGKKFSVSIRGGLEPWRRNDKRWKKLPYHNLIVAPLLKFARSIHVTCAEESDHVVKANFKQPFIVTNGISPEAYDNLPDKHSYNLEADFVFLFLSRIDKEKGIDMLLECFKMLCKKHSSKDIKLLIVGPDNQNYLQTLGIKNYENVTYIPGVYGKKKLELYSRCDTFILPSHSENFGNVIAEAMACAKPVITTTGTPWKNLDKIGCGYCIEPIIPEIYQAMEKSILTSEKTLDDMGKLGQKHIFEHFSWKAKGQELFHNLTKD